MGTINSPANGGRITTVAKSTADGGRFGGGGLRISYEVSPASDREI